MVNSTPTTFGKEMHVFVYRIEKQLNLLKAIHIMVKWAVQPNLNAHMCSYPTIDWTLFMIIF